MGIVEIVESGFVKAFIDAYYEYKIHSYYPDKDRLLYILCNSEAEKIEVTNKQIEYTKNEIKNLGWEALSFAYLLSCIAESGPNYIEPDKRFDFWLRRFAEEFQQNTESFCPIIEALILLSEEAESDENSINTQIVKSSNESDENFWEIFPKSLKPKNKDLSLEYLVILETEIEDLIKFDIKEFIENGLWDFDFEEYENFIESNKVIQNLFEISELFVQLNRLDMFNGLLIPVSQVETKNQNVELAAFNKDVNIEVFEDESSENELSENYIYNSSTLTMGYYDISEFYRYFSSKNSKKELYLVDKLEIALANYAINYMRSCDEYWQTYRFDPNFFNEFISGELLSEFNLLLHDFIKPLNNHEINRYLTASIQQFRTHTPEKRKDIFCEIYHDVYWYPNNMPYTGSSARDNYVLHVWKHYSNHFHLFLEATQNTYDIFKASLTIGSNNTISNSFIDDNFKKENKAELLKSNLYENGFFELIKIKSLSHDGQSKLIDLFLLNDTPYIIAMFEFLGYFKYLTKELGYTNSKIHSKVGSWLDANAQTIKCNMLVLNSKSALRQNNRYTSHLHEEKVKIDYQSLK